MGGNKCETFAIAGPQLRLAGQTAQLTSWAVRQADCARVPRWVGGKTYCICLQYDMIFTRTRRRISSSPGAHFPAFFSNNV